MTPGARPDDDEPFTDRPLAALEPVRDAARTTTGEAVLALELELHVIAARAHLAIAKAWDSGRLARADPARPPFADEVGGLLGIAAGRAPADVAAATERLAAADAMAITARRERRPRLAPLDVLARDFELGALARELVVAIAAPRLRSELARLYGILANDPGRATVDEALLGQLLGPHAAPLIARELDADRPLRRFGIVDVRTGSGVDRPFGAVTIAPVVARVLLGLPVDAEADPQLAVRRADRELRELHVPRAVIARALAALAVRRGDAEPPARICVRGKPGSGRHSVLAALAARAGRALGVIDAGAARDPRELAAALRRAWLRGLVPCVDHLDAADPDARAAAIAVLRDHPGPLAVRVAAEAPPPLAPGYLLLDLPACDEQARLRAWTDSLARHDIALPDPAPLAARYRVAPGVIERVCASTAATADPLPALDAAVRQHLETRLGAVASRVTRLASWRDVVLPDDIADALREIIARVRHRRTVFEAWGFDGAMSTTRGITALFQGGPGTGKTMVAGAIARELGLELYRVDVSRITSKWIGETEKNLGALFDAAEDGQVMLLFDEADSLFAKRTEVKSSVDRYANMEVNYLLQRLDSFEGVAVLTTNFGGSIDPAFKRRLTYRVTFPFPDDELREQLWRAHIPPQAPVAGAIDFGALARRFQLSGGYIRNAALRAAFLAADGNAQLSHDHLERAVRMELREAGKLSDSGTLD
jgi:hypothetical protein|nr:ATP-binding protein [Kofleriaceae bacterium]